MLRVPTWQVFITLFLHKYAFIFYTNELTTFLFLQDQIISTIRGHKKNVIIIDANCYNIISRL